jgi:hypothetical protein
LGAFQLTFGFSSSEFYLEFEDFLNLPIEGLGCYHFLRHLAAFFDNVLHTLQATADYWNYAGACCYKKFFSKWNQKKYLVQFPRKYK